MDTDIAPVRLAVMHTSLVALALEAAVAAIPGCVGWAQTKIWACRRAASALVLTTTTLPLMMAVAAAAAQKR
jgi:hypothetical protein